MAWFNADGRVFPDTPFFRTHAEMMQLYAAECQLDNEERKIDLLKRHLKIEKRKQQVLKTARAEP